MTIITQENGLELLLDKIADTLIQNITVYGGGGANIEFLKQNQKTIRNGLIKTARSETERLVLYQKDTKGNIEDIVSSDPELFLDGVNYNLGNIVEQLVDQDIDQVSIDIDSTSPVDEGYGNIHVSNVNLPGGSLNITNLIFPVVGGSNPLNISQFMNIEQTSTEVDINQANEYLNTNIYELLPDQLEYS